MADKAAKNDEVTRLRMDMSLAPGRPEFASAVGGYNRAEVNKYLDEQAAAAEAMRRVFYEKTQEMRDELSLIAEENKKLRAAVDDIAPIAAASRAGEPGAEETRKLVEQVAGILKAKHEAELASRDERVKSLARTLDEVRGETARLAALASGREAEIGRLNHALLEQEALVGRAEDQSDALAAKDAQIAELRRTIDALNAEYESLAGRAEEGSGALAAKDAQIAELRHALDALNAEHEALINSTEEQDSALAARDAQIAELRRALDALNAEHKALISNAEDWDGALAARDAEIAELRCALAAQSSEKEAALEALRRDHALALAQMRAEAEEAECARALETARKDAEIEELRRAESAVRSAKDAELENLRRELANRDERINSYTLVLAGSDARAADLAASLNARREEIASLTEIVEKKNAVIAAFNSELSDMRADVREARASLGVSKERIDALEGELAVKRNCPSPETLARKESEIDALTDRLARRESEIKQREEEFERLNRTLEERDGELARLREAINNIARIKAELDGSAENARAEAAHREKEACKIIAPNFKTS